MRVCAQCRHALRSEVGTPREWCDYNWRCGAYRAELLPTKDPVTGRVGFIVANDLGAQNFVAGVDAEQALPLCRRINPSGECGRFEQASESAT